METGNGIIVYTSRGCSYCEKVISILKEQDVEFEERNISNNLDYFKEWKDKEVPGTPATFYKDAVVLGVDRVKLLDLVNLLRI